MLEARGISFGYGSRMLYENFNFAVSPGERIALCAPSGFGKTTLCRILSGYETPWAGEVRIDGEPLPTRRACPVQLVSQHPELAVDPRLRMREVLREAGSVPERVVLGLGIQERWKARYPHELSGGELQRFCIARALAANPRYLIADEISTMLDALTQAQIWHFLLDECERRQMGLVFVSHSPSLTACIATRAIDLADCALGG